MTRTATAIVAAALFVLAIALGVNSIATWRENQRLRSFIEVLNQPRVLNIHDSALFDTALYWQLEPAASPDPSAKRRDVFLFLASGRCSEGDQALQVWTDRRSTEEVSEIWLATADSESWLREFVVPDSWKNATVRRLRIRNLPDFQRLTGVLYQPAGAIVVGGQVSCVIAGRPQGTDIQECLNRQVTRSLVKLYPGTAAPLQPRSREN